MEEICTPWRMAFIKGRKGDDGCLFCHKPLESDHHHYILHRGTRTFTILNLYPYTVGHLMVIPYRHLQRCTALEADEVREISVRLRQAEWILRTETGAGAFHVGINLGRAAGAGVEGHLHVHMVPRGTSPAWMGHPRPLPEQPMPIDEVYERLLPHFRSLA